MNATSQPPAPAGRPGYHRKTTRPANRESPWYTVADMARLFDVAERTIWQWAAVGKLPEPVRRGPRWSRWRKKEIDRILEGD